MPEEHFEFLGALKTSLTVGKYFICHAGMRPGVPLERPERRGPVVDPRAVPRHPRRFRQGRGARPHTPAEQPELLPNRINVDTGAYMTRRLTCAAIDADGVRFIVAQ
jgi:serine/threonine protein phosphatase 1